MASQPMSAEGDRMAHDATSASQAGSIYPAGRGIPLTVPHHFSVNSRV